MQNRSDSRILLVSALFGSLAGAGYWLAEYFFLAILPWARIPSHSLPTLHSGLSLSLLGAYTLLGGILGIATLRLERAGREEDGLQESCRFITLARRSSYLTAACFCLLCLASFVYIRGLTTAFAQPGFYVLLATALLVGAALNRTLWQSRRRRLFLRSVAGVLLALVVLNLWHSLLPWSQFFFLPSVLLLGGAVGVLGVRNARGADGGLRPTVPAFLLILFSAVFLLHAFVVEQVPLEQRVAGPERNADAGWPHVILIVLDTIRADHLSAYGYSRETSPNLLDFAATATLYSNGVATGAYSLPTHASMLTGLYPSWHGCHFDPPDNPVGVALDSRFETLPETLRRNGYRTFSVAANTAFLNPTFGLTQGFEVFDYRSRVQLLDRTAPIFLRGGVTNLLALYSGEENRELFTRRADEINQSALSLLEERLNPPDKFFLFLNYMDAHAPYLSPAPYNRMFPGKDPRLNARSVNNLINRTLRKSQPLSAWERQHIFSQYDGAIRYLDEQLGKLFDELKVRGLYDDSLIIITSDHGEAFGENNLMGHGLSVDQHQVHVPFIIKYPKQKSGRVVRQPVSHVDIAPTVMEALQLEARPLVQGVNLQNLEQLEQRTVIAEAYPAGLIRFWAPRFMRTERAIYQEKYKLIVSTRGRLSLHDLEKDPLEVENLLAILPDTAEFLSSELAQWTSLIPSKDRNLELDPEALERLRSLGYVN